MHARLVSTLIACTLCLASLSACAPLQGPGGPTGGPPGAGGRGDEPPSAIAQLQTRLQQTAEALQLTPRQQVLWEDYQEKVGALMADQLKSPAQSASRQNALQQIARKVDVVRDRLTAMEDIQDAAGKLYAALDDTQKSSADRTLAQTMPTLYSGLPDGGQTSSAPRNTERPGRRGGAGGPGGGMGGMGGGMGRM